MAKKQKKKYKKKYYTGNRVDMSKGGRVSYQVGGLNEMNGKFNPKDDYMSIGGPGGGQDRLAAEEAAKKAAEEAAK